MVTISKQDVLKIARMSNITIHEHEIDAVAQQISAVLSYALRVKEIATEQQQELDKNINVMRDDVIAKTDPQTVLAQAAERESTFFVVPAILETK